MANLCWTVITVQSGKDYLDKLQKEFDAAFEKGSQELGVKTHLTKLLEHIGYKLDGDCLKKDGKQAPEHRGEIAYIERTSDEELMLDMESDWVPMLGCIVRFVDEFIPEDEVQIFYRAEEPGCGILWTNDPDYDGVYCFNSDLDSLDKEYKCLKTLENAGSYVDEATLKKCLKKFVGHDGSICRLISDANSKLNRLTDGQAWICADQYQWQEIA